MIEMRVTDEWWYPNTNWVDDINMYPIYTTDRYPRQGAEFLHFNLFLSLAY